MGSFEQSEPLTTRLGNIIKDYNAAQTMQELLQNCDDAGARNVAFLLDKRTAEETGWTMDPILNASPEQLAASESTKNLHIQHNPDSDWLRQQFSGPALYQYDDAIFQPSDFDSLSSLGDGRKKCDPTKTGKFCLGFNCVYHLTDMPSFISGQHCVFLDPHKQMFASRHADGMQSAVGGWKFDLHDTSLRDRLQPTLKAFQCDLDPKPHTEFTAWSPNGGEWPATMFRFPLRFEAGKSLIMAKSQGAARVMTPETLEKELFEPFIETAVERLLFMRCVESVSIYVWEPGQSKASQIFAMSITDFDESRRVMRSATTKFVKEEMRRFHSEIQAEEERLGVELRKNEAVLRFMRSLPGRFHEIPRVLLPMRIRTQRSDGPASIDHWIVSTMVGGEDEMEFATAEEYDGEEGPAKKDQCMWAYAAVAALLASGTETEGKYEQKNGRMPITSGTAFCTLPTPIKTGLPVHIDGRWELKVDRNNLVLDLSSRGTDLQRTHWNYVLLERVAAGAYARLLHALTLSSHEPASVRAWLKTDGIQLQSHDYYRLFPQSPKTNEDFFGRIARPVFNMLGSPIGESIAVQVAGKTMVPRVGASPKSNFENTWRFFFADEAQAQHNVQFLKVLEAKAAPTHEHGPSMFTFFDKDGSGFVSKTEFQQTLREMMEDSLIQDLNLETLWDAADQSMDGYIDEEEFLQVMGKAISPKASPAIASLLKVPTGSGKLPTGSGRRHDILSEDDKFSGLERISFRLIGIDKVMASCFSIVDKALADIEPEIEGETVLPQHWAKVSNIIYRLFGSEFSVEHSLLVKGARLTDAPPEVFEELRNAGASRVKPTHVRAWFRLGDRLGECPELEHYEGGKRFPFGNIPKPLDDPRAVLALLLYCLSDHHKHEAALKEMENCALLPLEDGSVALVPSPETQKPLLLDTDTFPADTPHTLAFGKALLGDSKQFIYRPAALVFSSLNLGSQLGCARFTPAELARRLCEIFPESWAGKILIKSEEITDALRDKVHKFWAFLDWCSTSSEPPKAMTNFQTWPLLPTSSGHLLQIGLAPFALALTKDGQLTTMDGLYSHDLDLAKVLGSVGVPLVGFGEGGDQKVAQTAMSILKAETPNAVPSLENATPALLSMLHWVGDGQCISNMSVTERQVLLRMAARANLDEEQLAQLRKLPLFELQDAPGKYTCMRDGELFYTMADFSIEGFDGGLELLTSKRADAVCFLKEAEAGWAQFYAKLGVAPLPREVFYGLYAFEAFAELPEAVRLGLLADLRMNFEQLRDRKLNGETFPDLLKRSRLFWGSDDRIAWTVQDLLDPEDSLVQQKIMPALSERLPPPQLRTVDWMRILRSWGMPASLPMRTLLEVAKLAKEGEDTAAASAVLRYFAAFHNGLQQQEEKSAWELLLREFSSIPLGVNEQAQKLHCHPPSLPLPAPSSEALVPLKGARLLNKFTGDPTVVWSQQNLVHWPGPLPPDSTLEALGLLFGAVTLETILEQYVVVKKAVDQVLSEQGASSQRFRRKASDSPGWNELASLYEIFDEQLRVQPEFGSILDKYGLSKDDACVMTEVGDEEKLWCFVEPKCVFVQFLRTLVGVDLYSLSYDAPLRRFYNLRRHLKMAYEPTVDQLMGALQSLHKKAENDSDDLVPQYRRSMLRIAEMIARAEPSLKEAALLVDQNFGIALAAKLVLNDAPWLKDRVDLAALPLLHDELEVYGEVLGVKKLSDVVQETLVIAKPIASLPGDLEAQLSRWRNMCSKPHFRSGLWRLQLSAKLNARSLRESKFRLYELSTMKIAATSSITSRFKVWEKDVTLQETGSPSFAGVVDGVFTVYLLLTGKPGGHRVWERQLALQLDKYFHCRNPYAISEMLRASDPDETETLLDEMRVPKGMLNEDEKWLGRKLSEEMKLVPDSNSDAVCLSDHVNKLVAFQSEEEGTCCFGLLLSAPDKGRARVDCGPKLGTMFLQRSCIWAVEPSALSEEKMAELDDQERAAKRQKAEQKAEQKDEKKPEGISTADVELQPPTVWYCARCGGKNKPDVDTCMACGCDRKTSAVPPKNKMQPVSKEVNEADLFEYKMDDEWSSTEAQLREKYREDRKQRMGNMIHDPTAGLGREAKFKDVGDDLENEVTFIVDEEKKALWLAEQTVGINVAPGMDIVLLGTFDEPSRTPPEIVFYHTRLKKDEFDDARRELVQHTCGVLREICAIFNYCAYNVGLFYEEGSPSRFMRQRIFINVWNIELYCKENGIQHSALSSDPYPYLYMYGLMIHKIAHFFDAVHGTRHEFYMNELRLEYLADWLDLLESKGWDPAALEKKVYKSGNQMVKLLQQVVL